MTKVKTDLYQSQQYASFLEQEKQTLIQTTNQLQSNIQNLQQGSINLQSQLVVTQQAITRQLPISQTTQPTATMSNQDLVDAIKIQMREQASRDAVKEIRFYNGYSADKSISSWLKEAEQIADLYAWTGEDKNDS